MVCSSSSWGLTAWRAAAGKALVGLVDVGQQCPLAAEASSHRRCARQGTASRVRMRKVILPFS